MQRSLSLFFFSSLPKMPEYEKCRVCQKEFLKYDQRGFRNAGFTAHQNKCVEKGQLLTNRASDEKNNKRNQRLLLPASRSSEPLYSPYSSKNRMRKPSLPERQRIQSPAVHFTSPTHSVDPTNSGLFQVPPSTSSTPPQSLLEDNIFPVMQCNYCTPNFGSHQPDCPFLTDMMNQKRQ